MANEFIIRNGFISKSGSTVQDYLNISGNTTSPAFVTIGGLTSQFVKGDGSLDSNTYLTSTDLLGVNTDDYISGATFNTGDGIVTLTRQSGATVTVDLDGRYLLSTDYTPSDANTDDYITGATFNTSDGILTLTRQSGSTVTVDLDGRYLETHPAVSAAASSDNSGRTYIQDILLDTFGHITGITTSTETVVNTDTNDYITSGTFNISTGDLTLTRLSGGTVVTNLDNRYTLTGNTAIPNEYIAVGTGTGIAGTSGLTYSTGTGNMTLSGGFITGGGSIINGKLTNETLRLTTTRLTGGTYISWYDEVGLKGFFGFASPSDEHIYLTNQETGGTIRFGTSTRTNDFIIETDGQGTFQSNVTANSFITSGGLSTQFVKGDGTLDSNVYTTNVGTVTSVTAGIGLSQSGTSTENPTIYIDYFNTNNFIDVATNLEGTPISSGDTIIYHDATDNSVKKGFVSDLSDTHEHSNYVTIDTVQIITAAKTMEKILSFDAADGGAISLGSTNSAFASSTAPFITRSADKLAFITTSNGGTQRFLLFDGSAITGSAKTATWRNLSGTVAFLSDISGISGGTGTVTSVAAGSGMDFITITGTGTVTMGTPSTLTSVTTNIAAGTSHTHAITTGIANTNIVRIDSTTVADNEYARFTANGLESRSNVEVLSDIGAQASGDYLTANASDRFNGGTLGIDTNNFLAFGSSNEVDMGFTGTNLQLDLNAGTSNLLIRDVSTTRFTFNKANGDFTATGDINANVVLQVGVTGTQNGTINLNKSDNGIMGTTWEDNYYRHRISGAGTIVGWRWDNYETPLMTLSNTAVLTLGNLASPGPGTAQGRFHLHDTTVLGGTATNTTLIKVTSTAGGAGGNNVYDKLYSLRDATGTTWTTFRFHDSIDVDGVYNTPGTNTRCFRERDPNSGIQYFGTGGNYTLTIDGTNNRVGVGQITPSFPLDVNGTGRFASTVTATNFILSSDERLKTNIETYSVKPIDTNWKTFIFKNDETKRPQLGLIAQELEVKHPEFVITNPDGLKAVDYTQLLIAKNAELEDRVKKLEILINKLI